MASLNNNAGPMCLNMDDVMRRMHEMPAADNEARMIARNDWSVRVGSTPHEGVLRHIYAQLLAGVAFLHHGYGTTAFDRPNKPPKGRDPVIHRDISLRTSLSALHRRASTTRLFKSNFGGAAEVKSSPRTEEDDIELYFFTEGYYAGGAGLAELPPAHSHSRRTHHNRRAPPSRKSNPLVLPSTSTRRQHFSLVALEPSLSSAMLPIVTTMNLPTSPTFCVQTRQTEDTPHGDRERHPAGVGTTKYLPFTEINTATR